MIAPGTEITLRAGTVVNMNFPHTVGPYQFTLPFDLITEVVDYTSDNCGSAVHIDIPAWIEPEKIS